MTQTVPATAVLGPGKTGLTIGVTVLNLDGTEYAAFSTTNVAETSVAGTYRKAGGVVCPDAGGYLVWGVSGTAYAEATVESDIVGTVTTVTNVTNGVTLADGAITAGKFDASTAFPLAAVDSGSTYILRTGADGDTGETLSDQIDLLSSAAGSGAIAYSITVEDESNDPIDGVEVWITTDSAGSNVIAGTLSTDALGLVTFMLDAGTYYVWRQKSGYNFTNPVTITVS